MIFGLKLFHSLLTLGHKQILKLTQRSICCLYVAMVRKWESLVAANTANWQIHCEDIENLLFSTGTALNSVLGKKKICILHFGNIDLPFQSILIESFKYVVHLTFQNTLAQFPFRHPSWGKKSLDSVTEKWQIFVASTAETECCNALFIWRIATSIKKHIRWMILSLSSTEAHTHIKL